MIQQVSHSAGGPPVTHKVIADALPVLQFQQQEEVSQGLGEGFER